nr:transcription antitermination factor NusB [Ardenticatena sp.]
MIAARRQARELALQALYELDMTRHPVGEVIETRLHETEDLLPDAEPFMRQLVRGVVEHRDEIDPYVVQIAPEWPIEQMAVVDRNILRLALYELLYTPETPYKVVINEAVELAKEFGGPNSPRFINGALGTFVNLYLNRASSQE